MILIGTQSTSDYLQIITAMLLFVVCFAIGPGAIPWLITAELFAQAPRSAAVAVATLVNWLGNLVVGFTFPLIADALGTVQQSITSSPTLCPHLSRIV